MQTQAERIRTLLADHLGVEADAVTDDKQIVQDLGADSLDAVELVMLMEDEYGLEIPDEDAEGIKTVGDLVAYIAQKTAD